MKQSGTADAAPAARAEGPMIQFSEHPAGRDTMAAIAEAGFDVMRPLQTTNPYGDRISNAPGALSPRVARALDDRPAISVEVTPAGRETYAAITRAVLAEAPAIEVDGRSLDDFALDSILALEVEQVLTFLVRAPLALLDSPRAKERLVRERLAQFISGSPSTDRSAHESVAGVDVRPWHEPGVLLVRIRLKVPATDAR